MDRNTIALTAVIADIMITSEGEDLGPQPVFTKEDTVANFAKTCKDFLEDNKQESELLPIKYTFRK